ncbi:MAG: MmgE/PrpD family protein [Deltaproteobacteria bacterium]|nr:MmgE/PrpD family protein [Deltaproteobacteria bacterium]
MSSNPTLAIAEYVHDISYGDLPQQAIANAKLAILDTIGVMFAGAQHQVGRIIVDYVRASGAAGVATIIGQSLQTSPELAALANGILAHALDYDDHGHASTQSLPAALALGETRGVSGRELLLAYLVGREVCLHLTEHFDSGGWEGPGPKGRGWHSVGIVGSIGATAAAAKILGLGPQVTCIAFGVAASLAGGAFANRGTMTKPLHAGNAARNGVLAATLASKGFTADTTTFTSVGGFTAVFDLPEEWVIAAVKSLQSHFHIVKHGIGVKRYPSCSPTHRYVEAMRQLRSKYELAPEAVESITCTPSKSLRCLYPRTDLECKFSAAFSLAATLIDGEVNLSNCSESFLRRNDVQELLAKTVYTEKAPEAGGFVRVKTKKGQVYEQPLLPPRDLTGYEEIQSKFYGCAVPVIGESRSRQIEALVSDLEKLGSVGILAEPLRLS